MRSPSAKILSQAGGGNVVDIYVAQATPQTDPSGGPIWTYSPTPTYAQVPCTAQQDSYEEIVDAQERVTRVTNWKLIFARQQFMGARDKIIYVDRGGVTHTMYVDAMRDNAGRGAAFTVKATEKI